MTNNFLFSSCNAYEISEMVCESESVWQNAELGGAVYPTVSLTNHSCCPNTLRYNEGHVCVVRATNTINKVNIYLAHLRT